MQTRPVFKPESDTWTRYSALVLLTCLLAWSFDVVEGTIPQIVTPILIREWHLTPATMGLVISLSRWIGLLGVVIFPVLADVYGRRLTLMLTILGYSVLTGLTGLAQNILQFGIATSATRIPLSGETPVGLVMVSETAPTDWRGTATSGMVGGYPFGYLLAALAALAVVPALGWRALYFLGIVPALLIFFVRLGFKESPRYAHVSAETMAEGLKKRFDVLAPWRHYPRQMALAATINVLYLFTWLGWSAWMPYFLNVEKHLGFKTSTGYLAIWMAVAIAAYWLCGFLCDHFGRRFVIPAFCMPGAVLLVVLGGLTGHAALFTVGLIVNFLITGSFGAGLGYIPELFPTAIRSVANGTAFLFGSGIGSISPLIIGKIATGGSVAAGLPLLALSFFLIGPVFLFVARETSRRELADFVGQPAAVQ